MKHHTRLYINLRAYENNLIHFSHHLPLSCQLCAVVKADAYGHGLEDIAPVAIEAEASVLGIADNWEAHAIRGLDIHHPILRLRPVTIDEAEEAQAWDVEEIVGTLDSARELSQLGEKSGHAIPVHIKIDTGIGRMGFPYPGQMDRIITLTQLPGIAIKGAMTHFPCADENDLTKTQTQLDQFQQITDELSPYLPQNTVWHVANSAACLRLPQSHFGMVRVGIASYGLHPSEHPYGEIQPVMSWHTHVVQVRDLPSNATLGYGMTYRLKEAARIATLPIGYADGYLRTLSNKADVLIHGKRCPVVGRISMNMTTVDVTHIPDIMPGDDVVLLGQQEEEKITAEELAQKAGTINYEIACLAGRCNQGRRETFR